MNILMMTNTYTPHVGGVARSVEAFTQLYRARGHRVLVIAPEFEGQPEHEHDVYRLPAWQNFNGSDFSVSLPLPGSLSQALRDFRPDIVHSHHPFLVGAMAVRVARRHQAPLVFTHHTMYEAYTHYVPWNSRAMKRFAIDLSTNYANLCDHVFAPSASVAAILRQRGVTVPITELPTGVALEQFDRGSGPGFRAIMDIPEDAFVVGHLGRLAHEKNVPFTARAVARFLQERRDTVFLVVGEGPQAEQIDRILTEHGVGDRLYRAGKLKPPFLASAYKAMDIFAFASKTETQGMVIAEAMAAGTPVVALDAAGAREMVADGVSGRLIGEEDTASFARAIADIAGLDAEARARMSRKARAQAETVSLDRCADTALAVYGQLHGQVSAERRQTFDAWQSAQRLIKAEWNVLKSMMEAAGRAARPADAPASQRRPSVAEPKHNGS